MQSLIKSFLSAVVIACVWYTTSSLIFDSRPSVEFFAFWIASFTVVNEMILLVTNKKKK